MLRNSTIQGIVRTRRPSCLAFTKWPRMSITKFACQTKIFPTFNISRTYHKVQQRRLWITWHFTRVIHRNNLCSNNLADRPFKQGNLTSLLMLMYSACMLSGRTSGVWYGKKVTNPRNFPKIRRVDNAFDSKSLSSWKMEKHVLTGIYIKS